MPVCPRCALVGALVALLAFAGCDSTEPSDLGLLDGVYRVAELTFDPVTTDLSDADVRARLDLDATSLEIFGDDDLALLRSRLSTDAGTRRTDLRVSASRGRVRFDAARLQDETDLRRLLLPASFSLAYDPEAPGTLSGDVFLDLVNLEAFDPARYQDLTSVRGTLRVRLERR